MAARAISFRELQKTLPILIKGDVKTIVCSYGRTGLCVSRPFVLDNLTSLALGQGNAGIRHFLKEHAPILQYHNEHVSTIIRRGSFSLMFVQLRIRREVTKDSAAQLIIGIRLALTLCIFSLA